MGVFISIFILFRENKQRRVFHSEKEFYPDCFSEPVENSVESVENLDLSVTVFNYSTAGAVENRCQVFFFGKFKIC